MIDVYVLGDNILIGAGKGFTRGGAKLFIDGLMAAARGDSKPTVVAYRFGKFAYSRKF